LGVSGNALAFLVDDHVARTGPRMAAMGRLKVMAQAP